MAEFDNNTPNNTTGTTDGFTETVTSGPIGNVNNSFQIPADAVILAKPDSGRIAIDTDANATYAISFNPNDAQLALENGDLVFNFNDGSQLILGDFAEVSPMPTIMLSDGTILAGDVVVAQLQDPSTDVFNLETAAGAGAGAGGQFSYDDDLGSVIDLIDNLPPLPFTTLAFRTFEQEEINPDTDLPGTFIPKFYTPFAAGVAGGFEDWQPNQHVADFTEFPMQLVINYTPPAGDNDVVDAITVDDIPAGVRVFVGTPGVPGSFTEIALGGGDEFTITSADLGAQSIFMLPPANSDADFEVTVNLLTRDPDTGATAVLTEPAVAIIDAVADKPEIDGTVELADGTIDANAVSGTDGQNVKFNVDIDFFDNDGSETHTIVVTGVPQQWSLVSDDGLTATPANQPDGTITYTVEVGAGFDGTLEFNPNAWNSDDFGGPATVTFTANAEEVEFDEELLLTNNEAETEQTFTVTLTDDVPEVILVSGPAVLLEDDLTIPGPDTVDGTITVDFFSDAPGSVVLTTDGLAALGLTSQGDALTYSVSPDGLVVTAVDAGGDTVFTVTLDPTPVTNGTEETYTYTFEILQPLDHDLPGGADDSIIDIPVQFIATDNDGDTAEGQIDLQVVDDVPVAQDATETVDETTDLGTPVNGNIPVDFGADTGTIDGNDTFTSSVPLLSDGEIVTVAYLAGVYTGTVPGGDVVFTATLNDDGSYTFVQNLPLDHPDTTDANDAIELNFGWTATDYDGDTTSGDLTVTVLDDGPTTTDVREVALDETDGLSQTASGTIPHDFGEDGAGTLDPVDFNASGSVPGAGLSSGGAPVTVSLVGDTYTGTTPGGDVIFTMTINDDGSYDFEIFEPLDHADGSNPNDVINLNFEYQVVDGDGDVVTGEVTVPIVDDAPVALDDDAFIPEGSNTATGNVIDNDDVGEDVDGSLTQVEAPDGTIVTFAADGQTDADGTFIEVDGEYGTLKIYEDGDYTYTVDGAGPLGGLTTVGLPEGGTAAEMEASWGDVDLYAFDFGTSFTDGLNTLDLGNADDTITYTTRGIGVEGGQPELTVPDQVNYDPNAENSQAIAIDLQNETNGTKVTFSNLFNDEQDGEFGQWFAYDSDGNFVDTGIFGTSDVDYIDNNVGSITVDASGEYQTLVFQALPYGGTNPNGSATDSSDFFIRSIEIIDTDIVKDNFEYTLQDADGDTDTAVLEVCIEEGTPIVPVNVENAVDETFIDQTVSDTIVVENATGFALTSPAVDPSGSMTDGTLTSNGVPVTTALIGGQIVGSAGGETIFTLDLTEGGEYTFTLLGTLDHADGTDANDIINLEFTYDATGVGGQEVEGTITIHVADDVPTAVDDGVFNVYAAGPQTIDGNVLANDDFGQDGAGQTTAVSFGGTTVSFAADAQTDANGTFIEIDGQYGTLKLYEDGTYEYTVTNTPVGTSGWVGENFVYTMQDSDTDTDTATIRFCVQRAPNLEPVDVENAVDETFIDQTVSDTIVVENATGFALTSPAVDPSGSMTDGTLTSNGVPVTTALIGGQIVGSAGGETIFTLDLTEGGEYTFTLLGTLDHADGTDANDIINLEFTYDATGVGGQEVEGTITIHVADDVPTAVDDGVFNVYAAGPQTIDGNVLANDDFGQDGAGQTTAVSFGGTTVSFAADAQTDANGTFIEIDGQYGTLKLYEDGTYEYTVTNTPVGTSGWVGENFVYTMQDSDTDTDTATIRFCVQRAPNLEPVDVENAVDETFIDQTVSDTIVVENATGFALTSPAVDPSGSMTDGTLTSNGVPVTTALIGGQIVGSAGGETIFTLDLTDSGTYTFTLLGTLDHADGTDANDIINLEFTYDATGVGGQEVEGTITIHVADDVPTAVDEFGGNIYNTGPQTIDGNVLANDDGGQDGIGDVTQVTANGVTVSFATPADVQTDADGNFIEIDGNYGTLKIYEDGDYSYTVTNPAIGSSGWTEEAFVYTMNDLDTDTDTARLTFCVQRVPNLEPVDVENAVDETFIDQTVSDTIVVENATGFALGTIDGNLEYTSGGSQTGGTLTSNGVAVAVALVGGQIVGSAGGETIFTLDLNNDGTYSFSLLGTLDHADGSNPNDIINLDFTYTAENTFGQAVEGNISIDVLDDVPVPCPDRNVFEGVAADGNVLTGEGSVNPAAAGDGFGQDGAGGITQVEFNGDVVSFAADAQTDYHGTYIEIEGDNGVLKLYEDGDYQYVLNDVVGTETCVAFGIDETDIVGDPTSITENGITISVGTGDSLTFFDTGSFGSGIGIDSPLHNSDKVYNSESIKIGFDDPTTMVDLSVADIGFNNAGDVIGVKIYYSATEYVIIEQAMPNPAPVGGVVEFTIDAADFSFDSIYEIELFSGTVDGHNCPTSFLLNEVKAYYTSGAEPSADEFIYTIEDFDGDAAATTLTFEATDPSADTLYSSSVANSGNLLIENDVADEVFYDESIDTLDISDLLSGSTYQPGVSDIADYLQIESSGDVHVDIAGTGSFNSGNTIGTFEGGTAFDTINVVLNDDEGDIPVQII